MSTGEDPQRQASRAYVAAALRLIQAHADWRSDQYDNGWEWVRASDQMFRLQPLKARWWHEWAARNHDEFRKLPERAALLDLLRQDPEVSTLVDQCVGTTTTSHRVDERMLTDHLIWELGESLDAGELDLSTFDEAYDAWNAELRSSILREVNVAPLWGFDMPCATLDLGGGGVIEALSDEDLSRLFSAGLDPCPRRINPLPHVVVPERIFGVRIVRNTPRLVGSDTMEEQDATSTWNETNEFLEDVLISLRLFKEGDVATPGFATFFESWPLKGSTMFGPLRDFPAPGSLRAFRYSLSETEIAQFKTFFWSYRKARTVRPNELAFRRFAYASDRARPEDQIIDAMIAAEALFLPGKSDELTYRLALRMANFLHPEIEERLSTFRFMKNAYQVRSKIAHGSRAKPADLKALDRSRCENLREFALELQRVLRIALQKAAQHISSHGEFITTDDDWDALTVR